MTLKDLIVGSEEYSFLWEVLLRTFVMFIVVLVVIKLTGKRGVAQLSAFEIVIIISMGSAAGDPMFYKDVGLVVGIMVLVLILIFYRIIVFFVGKNERFERFFEGKVECVINEGKFNHSLQEEKNLGHDEFFAELRLQNVEHIGQVKYAYLETNGKLSIIFYPDEEVKYGLPVLPHLHKPAHEIDSDKIYACSACSILRIGKEIAEKNVCCDESCWIEAINSKRIA